VAWEVGPLPASGGIGPGLVGSTLASLAGSVIIGSSRWAGVLSSTDMTPVARLVGMDQPPGSPPRPDEAPEALPPPPEPPANPPGSPPPQTGATAAPAAPPAPPGAWPTTAPAGAAPPRPGVVTVAGIVLIVLGAILVLFGLVFVLVGAMWDSLRTQPEVVEQLGRLSESFGAFALVLGLIVLIWGVLQIVAGSYVLARRTWARITGIILAILGALAGLATSLPGEGGVNPASLFVSLLFTGGHVFAIWALTSSGRWFSRA
jgi:hypothetical protein